MTTPGTSPPQEELPENTWGFTRTHRVGVAMLLGIMLVLLVVSYVRHPARVDDLVVTQGTAWDMRLDPNGADEISLGRLPGVSEAMAREIVKYRDAQAKETGDAKVYLTLDDLGRVKVGTRAIPREVLEGLRPYLKLAGEDAKVGNGSGKLIPPRVIPPESQPVEPDLN